MPTAAVAVCALSRPLWSTVHFRLSKGSDAMTILGHEAFECTWPVSCEKDAKLELTSMAQLWGCNRRRRRSNGHHRRAPGPLVFS
jgi:hypothetical protein